MVDVARFAEFGDVHLVYFKIFGPVSVRTGAAEGKDNELGASGNGDET